MGFPSPATDYVEQTLTVERLCHYDANCRAIETSAGFAVVDISRRAKQGDHVLISFAGRTDFAAVRGQALITSDGEAIEGLALDDVEVFGVVTFLINRAGQRLDDDYSVV
ncbi:TPA: hypothetical protein ACXRZ0_001748 [Klebsiella pneumoniae]|uniref:hypothetical protein n=1 Tax=Klebsiella pneumoniae TaxID=573 RepID=UPI0035A25756|nr:hypothetical protein [Klebsiella pneumoniae]